jgi:hypothetical protein
MDVWNSGKNRWRYKEGSDEKIIEIELNHGKVAQIDADKLNEVGRYKWRAEKATNSDRLYYARTDIPKVERTKNKTMRMHVFLFPNILPPRDHIDHDSLNNTKTNIRCGLNGVNARNVIMKKKKDIGVVNIPQRKQTVASWIEANNKPISKIFYWSDYKTKDDAYSAALLCRQENSDRVITELEKINESNPKNVPEKYISKPRSTNSGLQHITIDGKDGCPKSVRVRYCVNKKRVSKSFLILTYDNNIDKTVEVAKKWLDESKTALLKRRKVDIDE